VKKMIRMPLVGMGALGLALAAPGVAMAQSGGTTYQANLQPVPLNGASGASGHLTLTLNGDQATVHETVSGLADKLPTDPATLKAVHIPQKFAGAPYPHVQHIHGGANGTCPTAAADTNHDGVISTTEGMNSYGMIQTTLSVSGSTAPSAGTDITIAPSGGSFTYNRTITLDSATLQSLKTGKAVIVVHGLNPATAPKAAVTEPNDLNVVLPGETKPVALLATSPALCGTLTAMPSGGVGTGGGGTAGIQHEGLIGLGGGLVVLGGLGVGAIAYRRRRSNTA
jgi:hypothetical protein